jgi:pyridoxal phosphate phosphatase PHOSPHO2
MKDLLRSLKEKKFDLIIISNSNSFVIETILKRNELFELFDNNANKIIANRSNFNQYGYFEVLPSNEFYLPPGETFKCQSKYCKANICKGFLLNNYIKESLDKSSSLKRGKVIFVGDGLIDYCPGIHLNSEDIFFVKRNSKLSKLLDKNKDLSNQICAQIKLWKNAYEIIEQLDI